MSYFRGLGLPPTNQQFTEEPDLNSKQRRESDEAYTERVKAAYFKGLSNKYGVALAYQIMKGVKTEAQAAAELAAKVAAGAPGVISSIVTTVKNNLPLFLILGLVVFGPKLLKQRR